MPGASKDPKLVNFCLSKDLALPVRVRLVNLSGLTRRLADLVYEDSVVSGNDATSRIIRQKLHEEQQRHCSLVVSVCIESGNGRRLTVPALTSVDYSIDFTTRLFHANKSSGKWLSLAINYAELPLNARLVLSFYDYRIGSGERVFVGRAGLDLFDSSGGCELQSGYQSVEMELSCGKSAANGYSAALEKLEQKLEQKESRSGADWLDRLAYRRIEKITSDEVSRMREKLAGDEFRLDTLLEKEPVYVNIELVKFEMPIVFSDSKYVAFKIPQPGAHAPAADMADFNRITYTNAAAVQKSPNAVIFDPEQYRVAVSEDPIESKFRRLERVHDLTRLDKDVKPTLKVRQSLDRILQKQFFEQLSQQEKNLIWKFRFFLLNSLVVNGNTEQYNNFIVNFIKCIDWDDSFEVGEFLSVLADLDAKSGGSDLFVKELTIVDCLELLSANYENRIVRGMAIQRLRMAPDDELELFMVQLVQSIANEPEAKVEEAAGSDAVDEFEHRLESSGVSGGFQMVESRHTDDSDDSIHRYLYSDKVFEVSEEVPEFSSALSDFVIERSLANPSLTNFFYWCLKVQVDEEREKNGARRTLVVVNDAREPPPPHIHTFQRTIFTLISRLATSGDSSRFRISVLRKQVELVRQLHGISVSIKVDYRREPTSRKVEELKKLLGQRHKLGILGMEAEGELQQQLQRSRSSTVSGGSASLFTGDDSLPSISPTTSHTPVKRQQSRQQSRFGYLGKSHRHHHHESLLEFPPIQMPLNPAVQVTGSNPDKCAVFKSSLSPLKIAFKAPGTAGGEFPVMYKVGDDLRQDQFVIQIITLMDKILQSENLDLRLTPYRILATGPVEGLIEFVPNSSLSSILAKFNNSILAYLQMHNPDAAAPHGVAPDAMDTYVRSCAGYCVITYLLGVGDRHLENLLLTRDGHFFHADFGYILGEDPKPFPPLMKLPIQVVEGMGGLGDDNYQKFCNYCFISYLTLRRNASLILNLFMLMINKSIPALQTLDPDNESEKRELVWKVQEKFMLDLNDEEAVMHFQRLIDDSVNAVYPVMIDRLHSMAQYWRA